LALVDPATGLADAVTLPADADGVRQFDDVRGNKRLKPDLEACVVVDDEGGERLLAFGSGSSPLRERVLVVEGWDAGPRAHWVDAGALYAGLRAATGFAGSELNVEGAVVLHGALHLFGRGNGAPREGLRPVNARCSLDLAAFLAYLRDPVSHPPPLPEAVVRYELGEVDGLRLGFTDVAAAGGDVFFTAAAEDSPDATRDGRVSGSVLGRLTPDGTADWTLLADAAGRPFPGKAEGLLLRDPIPSRAWIVVDHDDPARPSDLCDVELDFG
ncbi:MAG TPA: hypothetical protein VFX98_19425, partial [Longimicrobiaceae bacterium]|nr:hypothetical protein [Longimicrobiaceae bacterium]